MRNLDSLPYGMPKDCLRKLLKKVARQDSRHRSPEKGRDAECTYSSEIGTVKMDRPYVTSMPDERLPKKMGKSNHWKKSVGLLEIGKSN